MRRSLLRLLGLSVIGVAVVLYVNSIGDDSDRDGPDPAGQLQCLRDSHIAAAYATATPTTRETRTPEQLATAWARARSTTLLPGLHKVYEEPGRVDIAFDSKAHTVAVLTFRASDPLGWHLDAVVACQQPVTQRASPSPSTS